jgi:uncharacterized protein
MANDKHVPELTIKIDGSTSIKTDSSSNLETRSGQGILAVTVDLRLDSPDMFSVQYDMMALEKLNLIDSFKPGAKVEIGLGLEESGVLCVGEVSYIEPSFDVDTGYRTTISGYHKLHRLTRGQRSRTWGDGLEAQAAPTDTVRQVIADSKAQKGGNSDAMSADEIGSGDVKHHYIPQLNASDFEILQALGADLEYKADSDEADKVKFKAPDPAQEPVITLARERASAGETGLMLNAGFRLSTVQQYARVEVRSWDPWTKKNIVGVAESSKYKFEGTTGAAATGKALYGSAANGRTYIVTDHPVNTQDEANRMAQALFDQFSMDFVTGEVTIQGNPKAIPGATLEFTGFGKVFSGIYMMTSATHSYSPEEGYRTTIGFARNAHGA